MTTNRGFTLIENVVAIILLGIVITATVFSVTTARMYVTAARHHYQAISLARDEIERIIAGEAPFSGEVTIDAVTGLTGSMSVSNPTVNTVDVTVSWTEEMWADLSMNETIVMVLP